MCVLSKLKSISNRKYALATWLKPHNLNMLVWHSDLSIPFKVFFFIFKEAKNRLSSLPLLSKNLLDDKRTFPLI